MCRIKYPRLAKSRFVFGVSDDSCRMRSAQHKTLSMSEVQEIFQGVVCSGCSVTLVSFEQRIRMNGSRPAPPKQRQLSHDGQPQRGFHQVNEPGSQLNTCLMVQCGG